MIQARIIFSGTVQGVGFRATARKYAVKFNLTGWVKNLSNGSVEILVEGSEAKIEQFCHSIEEFFKGYIRNKEIQFIPAREKFKSFQIAY